MCHIQSVWKLTEISRKLCILICRNGCAESQIFRRNSFFSSTDIQRFLYSLTEYLFLAFDSTANSYWKKLRNIVMNLNCFFCLIFYIIFLKKRDLKIFKRTFWRTSLHQVLSNNKEVLCQVKLLSLTLTLILLLI